MHHILVPLITLGVYALRRVVKKLPSKYLPWLSVVSGAACAVVGGDADVPHIVAGAVEGLAASGLWSAVGKHVLAAPGAAP